MKEARTLPKKAKALGRASDLLSQKQLLSRHKKHAYAVGILINEIGLSDHRRCLNLMTHIPMTHILGNFGKKKVLWILMDPRNNFTISIMVGVCCEYHDSEYSSSVG